MLRIRLLRKGKKKHPIYRIVISQSTTKRDGKYIECIGHYDPHIKSNTLDIDREKLKYWISKGAQYSKGLCRLIEHK